MFFFSLIIIFLLGLCLGSFLNAWIYRTRMGISIWHGHSSCPNCKKKIWWRDLVPVVSFFVLRGKCRFCKKKISLRYPVIEVVTGILFLLVFLVRQPYFLGVEFLRDIFVVFFLEFIFWYDFLYEEIPDRATVVPTIFLLLLSLIIKGNIPESLLIGLLIGGGFFFLQFLLSKGKWIGAGDILLGCFMGVIVGSPLILLAFFLAYVGGTLLLLPFLLLKKINKQSKIPFGTLLVPATLITLLWGEKIMEWFQHISL